MKKKVFIIGSFTYLALAILALLFYKERTAFIDLAFHLFYILKDGAVSIQGNRFGSVFTQLFPLVSSKLGLSLSAIMKIYSLGFIFFYFGIFSICIGVLKKYKFGLALLLFNTVMVTQTFYWTQSEFPQGLAIMILYFAFLANMAETNRTHKVWFSPINTFFVIALAFFHPLLIFPYVFASGYFYYFNHIDKQLLIRNGLTYFLFYLIKKFLFVTTYDNQSMSGLKNFASLFPDYFTIQSNKDFLRYLITEYYLLIPLGIIVIYYFVRQKHYRPLFFIIATFAGYLLLVNVSFQSGASHFYIENLYLPLCLFLIIPFVFEILPRLNAKVFLAGLSIVLVLRVAHIYTAHQPYTERIEYLQSFLAKTADYPNKKLLVSPEKVDQDKLNMTWATPYEFWLLSTIETGTSRSITVVEDPGSYNWATGTKDAFITKWGVFDYGELPSRYFILQDSSLYQVIE